MLASYVSANQCIVVGDQTENFTAGRRIRANCGVDGYVYSTIQSSSYSAPNTTVTIIDSELTSNLQEVHYGIVSQGATGSLPIHIHDGSEGQGGQIDIDNIVATVSGTEGKYIYVTNSGIDYAEPPAAGADGATWYYGTGEPSNSLGVTNDSYFDYGAGDVYAKDSLSSINIISAGSFSFPSAPVTNIANAYDGDTNTQATATSYYGSEYTSNPNGIDITIVVDLGGGGEAVATRSRTYAPNYTNLNHYTIDASNDNVNWTNLFTQSSSVSGWVDSGDLSNATAYRYYRLNCTNCGNGFRLGEWQLSGSTYVWEKKINIDGSDGLNVYTISGSPGTEFGNQDETYIDMETFNLYKKDDFIFENILDGTESFWETAIDTGTTHYQTFWTSWPSNANQGASQDVWYLVDMGETRTIKRVSVKTNGWQTAQVDLSNVSDFSALEDSLTFDQGYRKVEQTIDLPTPVSVRYARVKAWNRYAIYSTNYDYVALLNNTSTDWNLKGNLVGPAGANAPDTFIELSDTPTTYSGIEGNYLRVTASGIQAVDGIVLTAPDLSEWILKVTVSGVLYTEAYSG